jgi:hypothetical protein
MKRQRRRDGVSCSNGGSCGGGGSGLAETPEEGAAEHVVLVGKESGSKVQAVRFLSLKATVVLVLSAFLQRERNNRHERGQKLTCNTRS